MGARAANAIDWTARGCRVALAASVAVVGVGLAADFGYTVPLEVAIQRGLAEAGSSEALEARARTALDAEDVALARGLADLGQELGRPLSTETLARLAAAEAPSAVAIRNIRGAARGFATGEVDGPEHSALSLGLAAAGVAATAATYATVGGAAPARFGLSVMKAARRTGLMTAEFAADLGRRIGRTAARSGDEAALGARGLATLSSAATELRVVGKTVGAAETVRLMKYVRSVDELPELRTFAQRFGARSRAVAELMGRASLRAFRSTIRLAELLLGHLIAVVAWFGSLLAGAVSNLAFRGLRFAALRA
jgi:hypothetical protein